MPEVSPEQLRARLAELQRELELGERRLQQLELEKVQVRDTLLRISGAMQLLQELLGESPAAGSGGDNSVPAPATGPPGGVQ